MSIFPPLVPFSLSVFLINTFFLKMGHSSPLFFYFSLFYKQLTENKCSIKVADDWIRTRVLWCRKRPLCQLRHNHLTLSSIFLLFFFKSLLLKLTTMFLFILFYLLGLFSVNHSIHLCIIITTFNDNYDRY